jgi:hypothetical protein
MQSQFETITGVNVTPEPAGMVLGMCAVTGLVIARWRGLIAR